MRTETSTVIDTNAEPQAPAEAPAARPHVEKRKNRTRLVFLLIAALLGGGVWAYQRTKTRQASDAANSQQTKRQPPAVLVATAPARSGDFKVFLNGLGAVTPLNTITVKTRLDGQLTRVAFREGQFVRQGDLLAEIDPRPYEVQLAQAQAQLTRDQATLNNSKADLARYQYLSDKGIVPKQQLDTQASVVAQNEAVIKVDDAQIDNAKLQLTYCKITAPISGRIGLRLVDPGNMVHAADTTGLVVITQIQPISVLFTIPEDSLNTVAQKLRTGVRLPAEAYDRTGQTKLMAGQLLTMDNQIDPNTGTNRLKAVFDNKSAALFPNQFVNIRLLVDTQKNKVLIPAVAIQRGPKGTFVYVARPDQTVEVRPITVGAMEGAEASIDKGVVAGEQVVVDGVDKLQAGAKIQTAKKQS
jgi:membrane fusion protein, multidrug efflux system